MVKSFKKVIASLLAVLMVVCAMPFTAFAAADTDTPDVHLIFNPVYTNGYFDYTKSAANDATYASTMLQEAPLTFVGSAEDATITGKLILEAEKTVPVCESLDVDPLEEDTELGVGDFFSVTVVIDGLSTVRAIQQYIQYSENIEPAGVQMTTASRKNYYTLYGISDGKTLTEGGLSAMDGCSAAGMYKGVDDGAAGNTSTIDVENRVIQSNNTNQDTTVDCIDVSTMTDDESCFTDPMTGELDYKFDGQFVANTFLFKIVDEGDISFSMYDTNNTKVGGFGGSFVLADSTSFGQKTNAYSTYAIQDGCPGSAKTTFFGGNTNTGVQPTLPWTYGQTEECKHANTTVVNKKDATCTEDGYTGDTKCTDCQEIIANGETIKKLGHTYTSEVTTDPTCTTPGVTTYTCTREGCTSSYDDTTIPAAKGHTPVSANNAVTATCKADGKESDTICDVCRETLTTGKTISKTTVEHTPGTAVEENRVEPTYTTKGSYDEVVYCTVCETELSRTSKEIAVKTCDHAKTTVVNAKAATCTEAGYTGDTKCDTCGDTIANGETIKALGHDMQVVPGTAVTATCKADGKEADMACSRGDKTETGKTISKSTVSHTTQTVNGKAPTCTEPGLTTGAICSVCGTVLVEQTEIKALGHTPVSANNAVAPTVAKDGKEADTICSVCTETLETGKTIKATGVNVTVSNANDSFGDVTPAYGTTNYAFGETVTLTGTPNEDCEIIGWEVGGKLVSTEATYTFEATVDVTVTPVFRPVDAEKISVIFYDKYSNVIASYMDVTAEEFQAAMATKIPTAPVYAGYTFAGYSLTDAQILALDKSTTIWAYYNEDKSTGFTVETTADAKIEISEIRGTKESDHKYVDVQFDTQAKVTAEGATAWKVDDAVVGYGESYTFFVGSDIKVVPVFDAVEAKPTVTMVKAYKISEDSHKIMFLASMNIPDGYKLVDHGFIYGKNMTAADLVLENVGNNGEKSGAGVVKKTTAGTNSVEQFGVSYGITAQTGEACAAAYLTFAKDGVITTIYSDAFAFNYATGKTTILILTGADD